MRFPWLVLASALALVSFAGCDSEKASDAGASGEGGGSGSSGDGDGDGDAGELDAASEEAGVRCGVDLPTACDEPAPTWADVGPIFEEKCGECHTGEPMEQWSFMDYGHVVTWSVEIQMQIASCEMPPPDAQEVITDEERLAILQWIRCGTPQ